MDINIAIRQDIEELKELIIKNLCMLPSKDKVKWLRSHDVMDMLGISNSCLQNMRNTGSIPFSKIEGTYFYKLSEIESILEKNKSKN